MLTEPLKSKLGNPPSLLNAVKAFERELLQSALDEADGRPTRAAQLVGVSHQTFLFKLTRHSGIVRNKVRPRRKSLLTYELVITNPGPTPLAAAQTITKFVSRLTLDQATLLLLNAKGDVHLGRFTNRPATTLRRELRKLGTIAELRNKRSKPPTKPQETQQARAANAG